MRPPLFAWLLLLTVGSLAVADVARSAPPAGPPEVDQAEILRRGDFVEHIDGTIGQQPADPLSPPADDHHKWFITLIVGDGCAPCERLKRDWVNDEYLLSLANPHDARKSWSHFNCYTWGDKSQEFRFAKIKVTSFPTILVQPPRGADPERPPYGPPSTVVCQLSGYDGDPRALAAKIVRAIRAYVSKLQNPPLIRAPEAEASPPATLPPEGRSNTVPPLQPEGRSNTVPPLQPEGTGQSLSFGNDCPNCQPWTPRPNRPLFPDPDPNAPNNPFNIPPDDTFHKPVDRAAEAVKELLQMGLLHVIRTVLGWLCPLFLIGLAVLAFVLLWRRLPAPPASAASPMATLPPAPSPSPTTDSPALTMARLLVSQSSGQMNDQERLAVQLAPLLSPTPPPSK